MSFVVGLDIGTQKLKGVVLSGTPRAYRVVDVFIETIPSLGGDSLNGGADGGGEEGGGDDELHTPLSLDEFVRKVLRDRGLQNADIVVGLDSKDCGIREFPVPFKREDQIQKTVAFEAEQHFLAFDIEEVILEWMKVGESNGKSHLLLFAARKELIEDKLAVLRQADVDPSAVDLDAAALANAFSLSPYYDTTKSTLLIDMGATSTKIVLLEDGKLKKLRSLRSGAALLDPGRMIAEPVVAGASVTGGDRGSSQEPIGGLFGEDSIERRFQEIEEALRRLEPVSTDEFDLVPKDDALDAPIAILSDEDYDRVQETSLDGDPGTELVTSEPGVGDSGDGEGRGGEGQDYRSYLERVGIEIQRTFATAQLNAPIELICLTGGLSQRDEARRFFQEEFDIETVQLDYGESLCGDLEPTRVRELGQEGSVALGYAAKGLGQDLFGVDFRKGPYRFEHRFEKLRFPVLNCAVLCFFVFLQLAYWSYQEYLGLKTTAVLYEEESADVYKTFFDKTVAEGRNPVSAARAQKKRWKDGGHGDRDRFLPFDKIVQDIGNMITSAKIGYFKMNQLDLSLRLQKKAATRSGRGGRSRGYSWRPSKSRLVLETDHNQANTDIERAFRSRKSGWFTAQVSLDRGARGAARKVTVDLSVKENKLNPRD